MKYSLIIVFLSLVTVMPAQELVKLTKVQAISETLENNFGIIVAKNNVKVAENNRNILNSGYLPALQGRAGTTYNLEDQEVTLRDGTANVVDGAETKRYNASLNLNYTLFDGLGRYYNYKRLKETYNLSELQARETIETTLLQLFSVYFEVARLSENAQVLHQTYANTKDRLTRAEYRFEYGQANKLEVLNAQVDLVTDSINLMLTRQELRNAKRDLTVVLNSDLERDFIVDTSVTFTSRLKIGEFIKKADSNNVRLQQAFSDIRISNFNLKASKSVYLPSLGLTGSYGWNEGNFPTTSFATSSTTTGISAGLSLSWDLFDGGGGITNVKNARIFLDNSRMLLEQLKLELARDIKNAEGNYYNRLEIFQLQEQNVVTASDNYNRSFERYKLGQITSVELRQAQINLLNAETNKNLAKYQAKLAELELLQLAGQLLNVSF